MTETPHLALTTSLFVHADDRVLARYVIEPAPAFESPRPYWHPLRSRAGLVVSDYRPADHSWHWGLSIAVSNIEVDSVGESVNLWGGPTWVTGVGYVQLPNNGSQRHDGWDEVNDGQATEHLRWCTASGREFVSEQRRFSVGMAGPSEWQLNVTSRWTNLTASFVRFGSPTTAGRPNAGYGGLFLRGSEALLGAQVVLDGEPLSADVAQGRTGSTMALAATDPPLTVALHANAANPVSPTPWFVRTEPVVMLCAAPFFHTKWTLAASESVVWSWRLTVSDTGGR